MFKYTFFCHCEPPAKAGERSNLLLGLPRPNFVRPRNDTGKKTLLSKLNLLSFPRKRESRRGRLMDPRFRGDDKIHVSNGEPRRNHWFHLDMYVYKYIIDFVK